MYYVYNEPMTYCVIDDAAYGMTEASPLTHMHSPTDIKTHTVGTVIPNTQYKVST